MPCRYLTFASIPLTEALTRLNKHSNNLMTRNLFLTLGAEKYGAPATLEKGARAVRDVLDAAWRVHAASWYCKTGQACRGSSASARVP